MRVSTGTIYLIFLVLLSYTELSEQNTHNIDEYNLPRRIGANIRPRPPGQNNQMHQAAPNNQIRPAAPHNQIRPATPHNQIRPAAPNNNPVQNRENNNPVENEDDEPPPALVTPDGRVIVNGVMVGWDHNGFVVNRRPEDDNAPIGK